MHRASREKKCFYASAMMTALVLLHVSLASISPFQLFDNISSYGFDSYIRAMDVSNAINTIAASPDSRTRTRNRFASIIDIQSLSDVLASFILKDARMSETGLPAVDAWNRLIDQELSSRPHADMVSRK